MLYASRGIRAAKDPAPKAESIKAKALKGSRSRTHKINEGDTIFSLLRRYNFPQQDWGRLVTPDLIPKGFTLIPDEIYMVSENLAVGWVEVKFYDLQEDVSYVFWRQGNETGSFKQEEDFDVEQATVSGQVIGSLMNSIQAKVNHTWISYRFMDAFILDYNLDRHLQRGARFKFTFEKKYANGQFIKYGEIKHAALEIQGQMVERKYVPFAGGGVFIGAPWPQSDRPLYAPVDYLHISSLFKARRLHPIKRRYQAHLGIDFALPIGEEIYTSYAGHVVRAGRNRAAGNFVVVRHDNNLETYYNHLSKIAKNIRPGVFVGHGQLLGYVGCTGYCTKPHLHFAVKKSGRFVNPIQYLKGFPYRKKPEMEKLLARMNPQE